MKKISSAIFERTISIAAIAAMILVALSPAFAQDASRPTTRGSNWNIGASCPTGQVATVTSSGLINCTDTVAKATTADTATTASTAQQAVTASSLSGNINAAQITGALSQSQVAGAMPSCGSGQVLTNTNGVFSCVTPSGGGGSGGTTCVGGVINVSGRPATVGWAWGATPGSYFYNDSPASGSFSVSVPSMGSGQSQALPINANASGPNYGASGSGSATASCGSNGQFTWSAVSASGCQYQSQSGNYICMTMN